MATLPLTVLGGIGMAHYAIPFYQFIILAAGLWSLGAALKGFQHYIEWREKRRLQRSALSDKELAVINMSTD